MKRFVLTSIAFSVSFVIIVIHLLRPDFAYPSMKDVANEALRALPLIRGSLTPPDEPTVPSCLATPWKASETLWGTCPAMEPFPAATTVAECADACCNDAKCITWQYRRDVGCLRHGDVRFGMEKDGPAAWCSDHPPQRWKGQFLVKEGVQTDRNLACDELTWNPEEEVGQCLGLGDVRPSASESASECMKACCADETCNAWQWNEALGCFYSSGMFGCQREGEAVKYEPFVGRRKRLDMRSYTDSSGNRWQMKL